MAAITLIQATRFDHTKLPATAFPTTKARRPAPVEQRLVALFLGTIVLKQFKQAIYSLIKYFIYNPSSNLTDLFTIFDF